MKYLISIYFGVIQSIGILALSCIEIFLFMVIFVKEENLNLFLNTFGMPFFTTLYIINFILLCFFGFLSEKYNVDTRK